MNAKSLSRLLSAGLIVVPTLVGTQAGAVAGGQSAQIPLSPAFEVASVKANTSGDRQASIRFELPNGFVATNQTLRTLISVVYQIPLYRLAGGPDWIASDHFDIAAKADRQITLDEKRQMLRTLLEDRFKLGTHRETHDTRVYALVLARTDGRLGPDLHRRSENLDCAAINAARQTGAAATRPNSGGPPDCMAFTGSGRFRARGIQLGSFAGTLSAMMRETVVDQTGLTGSFDVDLTASPEAFQGPAPVTNAASDSAPSLFTALQEQLGLKLEPTKGPVEVLVIDHVEKPTPD